MSLMWSFQKKTRWIKILKRFEIKQVTSFFFAFWAKSQGGYTIFEFYCLGGGGPISSYLPPNPPVSDLKSPEHSALPKLQLNELVLVILSRLFEIEINFPMYFPLEQVQ